MLDHQYIKKLAADAGFDLCGLAPCRHLAENESMLRAWLGKGYQSSLAYMERNIEKRADPRKLVEGARTAVVCAVSYKNRAGEGYPPGHRTKVASYACAADYHTTIRGMLGRMLDALCASRPRSVGAGVRRHGPAARKTTGRRSRAGLDRPSVAAGDTPFRHLCPAGRTAAHGRCRRLRPAFRRVALRTLPQLHRKLSDGRHRRPEGDRHGTLYLLPHDRERAHRRNRPRRLASSAATAARVVAPTTRRPRCTPTRPSTPCSTRWRWTPRHGWRWTKTGYRSPHGHDTADPQRTGTHPKQHRQRITPPRQHRWEQHRPGAKRLGSNPHPGEDGSLLHAPHGQPEPARVGVALVDTGARKAEHPCPECIRGRRGA